MAPRRPLTGEEKKDKNKKLRERIAMEGQSTKEVRLKEKRERAKVTRQENKRRRLDPQDEEQGREQRAQQARSRRQRETNVER